jgi:hypothetical protein
VGAYVILAAEWNSLELAKILVGILTPLAIFFLGVWISREARMWEDRRWLDRKLYERRFEFWDEMGPRLNDLLCFFTFVGHYREVTPPQAVKIKRDLDRIFFANRHLFPKPVSDAYLDFHDACFQRFVAVATDARLRSSSSRQRQERKEWKPEWDALFVSDPDEMCDPREIAEKYDHLVFAYTTITDAGLAAAGR